MVSMSIKFRAEACHEMDGAGHGISRHIELAKYRLGGAALGSPHKPNFS